MVIFNSYVSLPEGRSHCPRSAGAFCDPAHSFLRQIELYSHLPVMRDLVDMLQNEDSHGIMAGPWI